MSDYSSSQPSTFPLKHYGGHIVGTRATFCEEADLVVPDANVLAIPNTPVTALKTSQLLIDTKFFGMHIKDRDNDAQEELTFSTVRSHDLGDGQGRWQKIQPTTSADTNTWNWTALDAWVNEHYAKHRELIFTFFATPAHFSARSTEVGVYGASNPGIQAEPKDADMGRWDAYCTAVATRYLGKIKYYEVWNEPNMNNDGTGPTALGLSNRRFFFSGTWAKMAEMVRRANQAVKAVDPTAKIICPPVQGWSPTGTDTSGAYFTGMMSAATGDGTTTMKDWVDIVGVHLYPNDNTCAGLTTMIDRVNTAKTTAGVSALETWDTESGPVAPEAVAASSLHLLTYMPRFYLTLAAKGINRTCFYQYDHATMGIKGRTTIANAWRKLQDLLLFGRINAMSKLPDGRIVYRTDAGITII